MPRRSSSSHAEFGSVGRSSGTGITGLRTCAGKRRSARSPAAGPAPGSPATPGRACHGPCRTGQAPHRQRPRPGRLPGRLRQPGSQAVPALRQYAGCAAPSARSGGPASLRLDADVLHPRLRSGRQARRRPSSPGRPRARAPHARLACLAGPTPAGLLGPRKRTSGDGQARPLRALIQPAVTPTAVSVAYGTRCRDLG